MAGGVRQSGKRQTEEGCLGEKPSWGVATRKGVWRKKGKVISEEQLQNQYELLLATQRASCSGGGPTIIFIFHH